MECYWLETVISTKLRRRVLSVLGVAALAMSAGTAGADEIRRWRDAQGRLHVEIVGAGEGVDADGEGLPLLSTTELTADEKFSIATSHHRRRLEKRMTELGNELALIRRQIEETESTQMLVYSPTLKKGEDPQFVVDAQRDAFLMADRFRRDKADRLRRLRRDERDGLHEMRGLWRELAALRSEVQERNGGTPPPWWRDRIDCSGCPSAEEVEEALARRRRQPTPSAAVDSSEIRE